jgi:diacylglycerol kinase (ATP)
MSSAAGGPPAGLTLVVDLAAGEAEARRRLDVAAATLRARGVGPIVVDAWGPGGAADAIRAVDAGRLPVIVGDDRSIRAAVAALVMAPAAGADTEGAEAASTGRTLGVMAAHGQVDFVRTFGIPPDKPAFAAERLLTAPPYAVDVAEVTYVDDSGSERRTYFVGLAEVGFGGAAVRREAASRFRRTAAFSAFWRARLMFRAPVVRVSGERRTFEGRAHDVIVGNAQFGRHGIRLSPRSFPGDGVLDLLIMTGPPSQQVRLLPKMFQGEHVPDDSIHEYRARRIRVESDRPVPLHADGEYLGTTPARFALLPEAITLRI